MRQVFSSLRIENVEAVAKFLEDAGIEARITNGRSYRAAIRGNFSYRDDANPPMPAVWIVKSEDQPRARKMLREAGLMDSSRNAPESPLAMSFRGTNPDPRGPRDVRQGRAFRIKLGLLVVIAAVIGLAFVARPWRAPAVASPTAAATRFELAGLPRIGTAETPESLAVAVLRGDVPNAAGSIACIAVDGTDPTPALLAALAKPSVTVVALSRCPVTTAKAGPGPVILALGDYRDSPSGNGTIKFQRRRATSTPHSQQFDVRPDGDGWRVIQPF